MVQLLVILPLCHFSQVSEIQLCWFEGLCCYFLFYSSSFWFPEVPFLCIVSGYSRLSAFLAASLVPEKDISPLHFLCFLAFPLSCLIPILTVLHVLGIPSLWQPLGIPTQLFTLVFLQSSDLGLFFLFLPSFLIGFKACPFMTFGLQAFWAYHLFLISFSMAPCVISLGLGVVIF